MAYNNYYPATYQSPNPYNNYNASYPAAYAAPPQPQPQNQNGIIWVQGEAAAKAYPVQPGTSVLLMDSECENFYIKSTDNMGMPQPLRTFEYHEIITPQVTNSLANNPSMDLSEYIKRSEYDNLKSEFEELKKKIDASNDTMTVTRQKIDSSRRDRNGQ